MKENHEYNIITDGDQRYVNGNLIFVPYMEGTNDEIYKHYIEKVLALDWKHYKLYLTGGILHGWKTTDIDICITGEVDDDLPILMEKCHAIGPIDVYYCSTVEEIFKISTDGKVWEFAKSRSVLEDGFTPLRGVWKKDGLFWMAEKFNAKGKTYDKEPLALN